VIFSEEKNQKTFMSCARRTIEPRPAMCNQRRKQKFFASFFQKRNPSLKGAEAT
jgi:hypothetical protein